MSGSEAIMRYKTQSLAFSIFNIGEETEFKKKKTTIKRSCVITFSSIEGK